MAEECEECPPSILEAVEDLEEAENESKRIVRNRMAEEEETEEEEIEEEEERERVCLTLPERQLSFLDKISDLSGIGRSQIVEMVGTVQFARLIFAYSDDLEPEEVEAFMDYYPDQFEKVKRWEEEIEESE